MYGDYVCRDGINSLCVAKEWFVSGLLALVLLCLWCWMRSVPLVILLVPLVILHVNMQ